MLDDDHISTNDELVDIEFSATIRLWREADIMQSDAEGDVDQAVQNVIGGTGAQVIGAELL